VSVSFFDTNFLESFFHKYKMIHHSQFDQ